MPDELIGGRYRLLERLGVGGMAEVWAALDEELGRRVAVKLLRGDADATRFEREAHAVAALAHPNICQVYDYGAAPGDRPYIVLEYLPGGTLENRLATGTPLADDAAARIATEVAAALAHAHERGVVHRDLKPANILFDADGRAKIGDFGIARLGGAGTLTEAGTLLGTASYISPEQAGGEPATPASDVYSFGVILYRMLTGRLPFESPDALELVTRHRDDPVPPPQTVRADVPAPLARVAMAALAKDPARRPPDGRALADELAAVERTRSFLDDRTTVLPFEKRRPRAGGSRHRPAAAVLIGLPLLAAGVGAAYVVTREDGGGPAAPARESRPRVVPLPTATQPATEPDEPSTAPGRATSTAATTASRPTTRPVAPPAVTTTVAPPVTTTRPEPATTRPPTAPPTTAGPTTAPATTSAPTTTAPPATTAEPTTSAATTTEPVTTTEPPATTTEPLPTTQPPPTTQTAPATTDPGT